MPTVQIRELQRSARKPIPPSSEEDASRGDEDDEPYNFAQHLRRERCRPKQKESAVASAATKSKPVGRSTGGVVYGKTSDGCTSTRVLKVAQKAKAKSIPPPPPPPLLRPKEQLVTCTDPKEMKKRKRKK